ncbi:MAG: DUF151 domain-containing protein [Chloroflexota bacterium]|nr:DUF151 domain-containing protein [Chloroflexota bacterium]
MQEEMDAELVALARLDNTEAFRLLIERYHLMAFSITLRLTDSGEAARELVQEAMLQAYLSLDQLRDTAHFKNWYYGITLNVCRAWRREQKLRRMLSLEALIDEQQFEAWCPANLLSNPEELVEEQELREAVQTALQILSPKNRLATWLFYYEYLSIQEIATKLAISPAAVKNRLHKGRDQLRRHLRTVYPEIEPVPSGKRRKHIMTQVRLAKVIPQEQRILTLLLDEQGQRIFPLWMLHMEGYPLAFLMNKPSRDTSMPPEPSPIDLVNNLIQALQGTLEEARIEALQGDQLYGKLSLHGPGGTHEIKGRVGDVLALAAHADCPIVVAGDLLDRRGVKLPTTPGKTLDEQLSMVVDTLEGTFSMPVSTPQVRVAYPRNLRFEEGLQYWDLRGSQVQDYGGRLVRDYECGLDANMGPQGAACAYLKSSASEATGFGSLRQAILADTYRGKRVQLSGAIRTSGVKQGAGLYLRIVDPGRTRTIEDRQESAFQGTQDWTRYTTEVDVPEDSVFILFGVILSGTGQVWLADVQLEVVP